MEPQTNSTFMSQCMADPWIRGESCRMDLRVLMIRMPLSQPSTACVPSRICNLCSVICKSSAYRSRTLALLGSQLRPPFLIMKDLMLAAAHLLAPAHWVVMTEAALPSDRPLL
jgi:hypothetical protein